MQKLLAMVARIHKAGEIKRFVSWAEAYLGAAVKSVTEHGIVSPKALKTVLSSYLPITERIAKYKNLYVYVTVRENAPKHPHIKIGELRIKLNGETWIVKVYLFVSTDAMDR